MRGILILKQWFNVGYIWKSLLYIYILYIEIQYEYLEIFFIDKYIEGNSVLLKCRSKKNVEINTVDIFFNNVYISFLAS